MVRFCGFMAGRELWYSSNGEHSDWYLIDLKDGLMDTGRLSDLETIWGRYIPADVEGTRVRINPETGETKVRYSKANWNSWSKEPPEGQDWIITKAAVK
jgi:hypothetical protein